MSDANPAHLQTPTASAVLSQYRFVRPNPGTNQRVIACSSPLHRATGVVQNTPQTGQAAYVIVHGDSPITYGGTVAAGDPLTSDSLGRAVVAAPGQMVHGYALKAGFSGQTGQMTLLRRDLPPHLQWTTPLAAFVAGSNWGIIPGAAGKLLAWWFQVGVPATGTGKAVSLTPTINGTPVVGGLLSLTTGTVQTAGAVVAGNAITGAQNFGPHDTIAVSAAVTAAFTDGYGSFTFVLGS